MADLPTCHKCRREVTCLRVSTAYGDRTICIGECYPLWRRLREDLLRRIGQMLVEHDADFFDEPTRRDIRAI